MQRPRWSLRRARALVGTKFQLIAGLVGFVLVAWLVELVAGIRAVSLGPILAAVMAAIPAVLWLGFFYLMDRHEPEPKQLVAGVCVLGALIAGPLADFVQYQAVPPVALTVPGLSAFSLDRIIHAMLVVGLSQEMCKYAVVRYTIYMSREFDEPMDGIVYMMACGTGFAVWVNYHRLSGQNHEVYLSIGAAQAVVIMLGLLGAAAFNGQFTLVENWVLQRGLAQHPWYGVGYAAACAAAMFGIIWLVSQRLLAQSPFRRAA